MIAADNIFFVSFVFSDEEDFADELTIKLLDNEETVFFTFLFFFFEFYLTGLFIWFSCDALWKVNLPLQA